MTEKFTKKVKYIPPKIEIFEFSELYDKLGPVISCSGFGGSSSGC